MRQIKFRAWDVFGEKMDYEVFLDPNGKVAAFSPLYGFYVRGNSDDEMKLMQFTGLCDRNGKEIYEGDILKTSWYNEPLEVTYLEHEFILKVRGMVNYNYVGFDNFDNSQDFEVIGNIFENPVLLKGDSKDA